MERTPPIVAATLTVAALSDAIARGEPGVARRQATLLAYADGKLAGIITRGDLMRVPADDARKLSVLAAGATELEVAIALAVPAPIAVNRVRTLEPPAARALRLAGRRRARAPRLPARRLRGRHSDVGLRNRALDTAWPVLAASRRAGERT